MRAASPWSINMTSNKNSKRLSLRSILAVAAVVGLAFTLSGCKDETSDAPTTKPPVAAPVQPSQPAQPALVRTVKLMPPESGENQRVYKKTPGGTLVEMQVDYRDGRVENYFFRPDGSVSSKKEFYPYTGVLKSTTDYANDGATVTGETLYRGTGALELTRKSLADGTQETTRYRVDGKRLHSVTRTKADGTLIEATFYQPDGKTLRATGKPLNSSETEVRFFDAAGNLEKIRVAKTTSGGYNTTVEYQISVLRPDSTVAYKQVWSGYRSSYYSSISLKSVEEFEADGKTLKRKLTFNYSGTNVNEATDYENGVKKAVRTYRWDGTLETTKTYDASGSVIDTKTNTTQDNLRETVSPQMVADQGKDDPLSFLPGDFQ